MASLSGVFNVQQFTDNGAPAASYRLYTYAQGTTTQKAAYTDAAGLVAHTYTSDGIGGQFIALNARGELPSSLYLTSGGYSLALKTAAGATVWTRNAEGAADGIAVISGDDGASLVGFANVGTGAELRTVESKLRDFVCILDYIPASEHAAIAAGTSTYDCAGAMAFAQAATTSQVTASSFYIGAKEIFFPKGAYRFSTAIELKQSIMLRGEGKYVTTILNFDNGSDGVIVNRHNTLGRGAGTGYGGDYSGIQDMMIAQKPGALTTGRGISLRARAVVRNVYVIDWKENGVHIAATAGGALEGNANNFILENVDSTGNGGHGFFIDGADANAGILTMCSARGNVGDGFRDSSFLGNTFIACHAEDNGGFSYLTEDVNARSTFIGCYSEGGGGAISIGRSCNIFGGLLNSGIVSDGGFSIRGGVADGRLQGNVSDATPDTPTYQLGNTAVGQPGYLISFFNTLDASAGQGFRYDPAASGYTYANTSRTHLLFTQANPSASYVAGQSAGGRGAYQTNSLFINSFYLGDGTGFGGGERLISYGAAAPSTGAHARGEVVYNNAPSSGGFVGWVCTAGGTPGTWKTFGLIS